MERKGKITYLGRYLVLAPLMMLLPSCASTPEISSSEIEAHACDGAIALNWEYSETNLTGWRVYCDDKVVANTPTNYFVVKGLENGKSYNFSIAAISGDKEGKRSDPVSASPKQDAFYNVEFEEDLTPLEKMLSDEQMNKYLSNSLVSTGNNYRTKKFLEKVKNGEETTVAYFGGSITVGKNCTLKNEWGIDCGYAYNNYDYLRNYYAKTPANLHYVNAAISGTATQTGINRIDEDVISHNPDLVFIEFAANNSSAEVDRLTFDSCVRKILNMPNAPAVIVVLSATYYTGGGVSQYIEECAKEYDLPVVSVDKGLKSICKTDSNGMLGKDYDPIYKAFIDDDVHPNNQGHRLFGKAVDYLIDAIDKEDKDADPSYNLNFGSRPYDNYQDLDERDDILSTGSWEIEETVTPAIDQSMVTKFSHGYVHKKGENNPFEINVYAKNFMVVYRCFNPYLENSNGTLVINYQKVGESKKTIEWDVTKNYRDQTSNGWDNPVPILLFSEASASAYNISISMGSNNDNGVIFAMGYSN